MKDKNNLNILSSCAICRNKLKRENLTLVLKQSQKLIFHATCSKCHAGTLITLSGGQKGLIGIGMVTDLDKSEVREKLNFNAISADELIEAYEMVKRINS